MAYVRTWHVSGPDRLSSNGVPDIVYGSGGGGPVDPPPPPVGTSVSLLTRARGWATYTDIGSPTARDLIVYGRDMPTYTAAGCTDRTVVAANPLTGKTTLPNAGTAANPIVIRDKWYQGQLVINGGYYDFYNIQVNGDPTTVGPLITAQGAAIGRIRVYDSDLWAQVPQWNTPFFYGWRTEFYRCYIRNCTDGYAHVGIGKDGTNGTGGGANYTGVPQGVKIYGCLVERCAYMSPDPGAAGGLTDNSSHLDALLQTRGGDGIEVVGNRVLAWCDPTVGQGGVHPAVRLPSNTLVIGQKYSTATDRALWTTSAIMCSPIHGQFSNFKVKDNWLSGGAVLINFAGHTAAAGPIEITGNRVGTDHRLGSNFWWLANPALPLTIAGNVQMSIDRSGRPLSERDYEVATDPVTVLTATANTRSNGA